MRSASFVSLSWIVALSVFVACDCGGGTPDPFDPAPDATPGDDGAAPDCESLVACGSTCCGEGEFHQITRMVSNDGATRIIEGGPVPVRLKDVNQVVTSVEYFVNLKIPGPGAYWIEILLDQQLKLRYPLHVRKQHEPA